MQTALDPLVKLSACPKQDIIESRLGSGCLMPMGTTPVGSWADSAVTVLCNHCTMTPASGSSELRWNTDASARSGGPAKTAILGDGQSLNGSADRQSERGPGVQGRPWVGGTRITGRFRTWGRGSRSCTPDGSATSGGTSEGWLHMQATRSASSTRVQRVKQC